LAAPGARLRCIAASSAVIHGESGETDRAWGNSSSVWPGCGGKEGESTETKERQSDRTEIAERRLRVCMRLQLRSVSTLASLLPAIPLGRIRRALLALAFAFAFACCPRVPAAQEGFQHERFPMSPNQPAAVRLCRAPLPHQGHFLGVTLACLLHVSL
jgi:hypothetical protein